MKKTLIIALTIFAGLMVFNPANAQRGILIYDNIDLGDSTIVNLSFNDDVHKWSGFHVEALFTSLAATDTTAKVEIYNTLNNDFTDATDLDTTPNLIAADGAGGTGTIMKTATITNSYLQYLRFVCDPSANDSGSGKLTLRIVPVYKTGYTPKN